MVRCSPTEITRGCRYKHHTHKYHESWSFRTKLTEIIYPIPLPVHIIGNSSRRTRALERKQKTNEKEGIWTSSWPLLHQIGRKHVSHLWFSMGLGISSSAICCVDGRVDRDHCSSKPRILEDFGRHFERDYWDINKKKAATMNLLSYL